MTTHKDAITLLKADHAVVKKLFKEFEAYAEQDKPSKKGRELADRILHELTVHTSIEERILYPVVREAMGHDDDEKLVLEAYEEHHVAKSSIVELADMDIHDERFNAKMKVLTEMVLHHVNEEETELFPKVKKICSAELLVAMGEELEGAKASAPKHPVAKEEAPRMAPAKLLAMLKQAVAR